MSKSLIDTYKGFEIYFDTDGEKFVIEGEDSRGEKRSYSAAKKYINDFIKENKLFGEFDIIRFPNKRDYSFESNSWQNHPVRVKGIHSNGNFLCETYTGEKFQLSGNYDYDLQKYCLPSDLDNSKYNQGVVDSLREKINELNKKIMEEESKLPENIFNLMKKVKEEHSHLWK